MTYKRGGIMTPYKDCVVKPPAQGGVGVAVHNGVSITGGKKGTPGEVDEVTFVGIKDAPEIGSAEMGKKFIPGR